MGIPGKTINNNNNKRKQTNKKQTNKGKNEAVFVTHCHAISFISYALLAFQTALVMVAETIVKAAPNHASLEQLSQAHLRPTKTVVRVGRIQLARCGNI